MIRLLSIALLLIPFLSLGADPIALNDRISGKKITGKMLDIFEDKGGDKTFKQVSRASSSYLFHTNAFEEPLFYNTSAVYWVRFRLISEDTSELYHWILELDDLNYSEVFLYQSKDGVHYNISKSGLDLPFYERSVDHKNNVFLVDVPPGKSHDIYLKFRVSRPVKGTLFLWSYQKMLASSNTEYFLLALFYGIALAMVLYNLFLFLTIRDAAYIFYVGYILSMVFYTMSLDGLGFQYIWSYEPIINYHVQHVSIFSLLIFALLYSHSFLKPVFKTSKLDWVFLSVIVLRTGIFIAGLTVFPGLLNIPFFDILAMLFIYGVGIYAFFIGYKPARFFILAFTMLFLGFAVTSLAGIGLFRGVGYLQYALNLGVTLEMVLLSFSLADRIKVLMDESSDAREQVIYQLQEKEQLKDRLNRMLEEKVLERTKELEDKNKQLDSLIYKSSHDLKGPLKSIIGLTTVGKMDVKDPAAREYFDHILLSTKRLDRVLADLLDITKVNENKLKHERIDFAHIINEILLSFENIEGFKDMKIDVSIQQEKDFYGDEKMLYSVFQNMIENAFKYRDPMKPKATLDITIRSDKQRTKIEFKDNGLGIDNDLKDKVFDMFFKANEQSSGTGLGLYLVKLSIQKMGGHVYLDTARGRGSLFTIVF